MVGPKGLSAEQVKRINAAFVTAFSTPEVKEAMAKQGNTLHISTPEFALAHFKPELVKYAAPRQFPFQPLSFCMWASVPDIAEFS